MLACYTAEYSYLWAWRSRWGETQSQKWYDTVLLYIRTVRVIYVPCTICDTILQYDGFKERWPAHLLLAPAPPYNSHDDDGYANASLSPADYSSLHGLPVYHVDTVR
jgi:hypothetical protein